MKSYNQFILENQLHIVKSGKIPVVRYYKDENNKFTNDLRGGTWFSYINDTNAKRYQQSDKKLGGMNELKGVITFKKPMALITDRYYVLSDFQVFPTITIFTEKDKDILFEAMDLEKSGLIKLFQREISNDKNKIKILKSLGDFNIANIIAENLLSKRLKELNTHDIFIRLDENYNIFEIFDVFNKFKEL